MALPKTTSTEIEAEIERLTAQRNDTAAQEQLMDETRLSVQHFEVKYGIPSNQIHQAIDSGTLEETLDVVEWIFDYNILRRAGER